MSVEVKLELGHRAVMREKVTEEGFTHDWTVFVRGAEGHNIHFFVEKVVFHLHESFPKPKRVVKEPPYSVSESGYAGFIMPIDVYFRTREEPKKVTFKYDLYLRLESPPVSNIRIEKLTFQNPSDDFRQKLIKAGGLAGALSGSASGGSASLSTQACAPPVSVDDHPPVIQPKAVVVEKKPRSHVASKEIKSSQPPPPKPSQPFTDIFGAPIRTKNSPDPSSVKSSKDSGHSSQSKSKSSQNSSVKEAKSTKESHKIKESHHSKDSRHSAKESHPLSKDSHPLKDSLPVPKEESSQLAPKENSIPTKEPVLQKEIHHTSKETHKTKEHHSKESSKKDSYHILKEGKNFKESRPSDSKDSKPSKSIKLDKESNKTAIKRPAPIDSHGSHGNTEKKKKFSPVPSESSNKSSSHSKHKSKESKEKSEKQKIKPFGNSIKKEEEKPKIKKSPALPPPPPPSLPQLPPPLSIPPEPKEMPKAPKPSTPKQPSTPPPPPPPVQTSAEKPPSPPLPPKSPLFHDSSLDSDSDDESHKSPYNKAHYSSAASSISDSSLHSNMPGLSDQSIISPLSDDDDDDISFLSPSKKKPNSDYDLENGNEVTKPVVKPVEKPVEKIVENRPMPKLNKKSHHKSSKHHKSESFHHGNGIINNDATVHPSPKPIEQFNSNNSAYREELLELQRLIMSSEDRKLLQNIVDLIEKTGKYEITSTTFDFDLCMLDKSIIQKIKLVVANCDKS